MDGRSLEEGGGSVIHDVRLSLFGARIRWEIRLLTAQDAVFSGVHLGRGVQAVSGAAQCLALRAGIALTSAALRVIS